MTTAASRLPGRRAVLTGCGLLVLAGCLPSRQEAAPAPAPDPELRVRAAVAREVAGLGAAYDAVLRRFPGAATELGPMRAEHDRHGGALTGSPARALSPTAVTTAFVVPATLAGARRALAELETAAAGQRAQQAVDASPGLARLLASVAACEAAHAALLRRGTDRSA